MKRIEKIIKAIWDSLVIMSVFVLFTQIITNAFLKIPSFINFFLMVAIVHLISVKYS